MWERRRSKHHHPNVKLLDSKPLPSTSNETESSVPKGQRFREFTIAQIRSATQGFNESLLIGNSLYKGTIKNGTCVVVKRRYSLEDFDFKAEVKILPMLGHTNVVCLIGYCLTDPAEKFLAYEYMSNGSLGEHLHKHGTPLSWSQRLNICIDVARALDYLHNGASGQEVIHGYMKSSHILLDNHWSAKITGFRFSKIITTGLSYTTSTSRYDMYTDPESMMTHRLSKKSDVYSFGVVLLEVLSRRPASYRLVGWAKDRMRKGNPEQIIDPDLRGQVPVKCLNYFARIVESCLNELGELRITMAEVLAGLEALLALQETPDDIPIPQMGIPTSGRTLRKYFYLSQENSGGGYFRKDIDELADLRQRERWYEQLAELQQRAGVLTRMKEFLHLIWSYPVKKEAELNFGSLVDKISLLNEYIRKSMSRKRSRIYSRDRNYLIGIQRLVQYTEEHLDAAAFDMLAYLPEGLVHNRSAPVDFENIAVGGSSGQIPFASFWSDIPGIHASAVASATRRAVSCIKDLKVKKLGISGSGVVEVAETLKNMPKLRRAFDMVLCVRVKHHGIKELINDIEEEIYLWRKRGDKRNVLDQFLTCLFFIDCDDGFIDLHDPEFNMLQRFSTVQIVMTCVSQNAYCPVDMEIRVEDHLLPWILFSTNVDLATLDKYTSIQKMAASLIENCHGHLLAIILLARALRGVVNVTVWELALQVLTSQKEPSSSSSSSQLGVMVRVLRFIWSHMETLSQRCVIQLASCSIAADLEKSSLIKSWVKDGLVKNEQQGEHTFEDLIRSFLLEQVGYNHVRMRDETRVILLNYFVPRAHGFYLKQDGSESNNTPNIEEWNAREIHLSNNIISELPDNPNCPILVHLFLHFNQDLMDIPSTFFDNMPSLQVLDLSGTSIKCLPSSISKLTILQKLFIRHCDLLTELPPEIGALKNLKVFDSEGTQLVCLHRQFGCLTKLECLKFSLYNLANSHKQSMQIVSVADLSKLVRLNELSIFVDSYYEWWENEVKLIIDNLLEFWNLESMRLYFPTTKLLEIFMETKHRRGVPIYQHLSNFCFLVGRLRQRLLSRVPRDLDKTFVNLPKCLKYTNGEGEDIEVIGRALEHANALFLDCHWTIRSLSAIGRMENLKFCLLAECNEMQDIVNGIHLDSPIRLMLGSLEYLSVHYMKNLKYIWNGLIVSGCLYNLKTLAVHTCPALTAIFTQGLLDNLNCLEYLVVEDCTTINSLVSLDCNHSTSSGFLPSLKKISLLHLPELVSISRGISIAPRLESLVVYNCPKLKKFSCLEVSDEIREIKGENEWWDALKWCEPEWTSGQPVYLARVFIPLGTDGDIMDELADAVNLLPRLSVSATGIGELTKEAGTVQVDEYPGDAVAGTRDKGKGKV